ncbi:hypothetical protein [Mycobacterium angelicum]|uniref:VWFA domain-containing protein n=1 Tax=Mycobacterium angelicum TaxID=470074 RepID=A0A1X0A2I3_MYCAN|nr:hypothetical protein [Mycobacterium angelicum]MCV7197273.1 hypothetical protein [Mycobacterium angelicum]ORA24293.1 hypothetical protein BST12_05835 [Mycobacterium angelicum]
MELKWWPVLVVGTLCLAGTVAASALLPMARLHRVLRPLAHVDRLTRLPEYARVYRIYFFSVVVTGVLLLTAFVTSLVASARPVGMSSSTHAFDTAHPEDIMLCVGEPVTDPTTADFFNYYASYAQQLKPVDSARIGVTSATLRVIPLTRDHQYTADRLKTLVRLARIQQDLDTRRPVAEADRTELKTGIEAFSRPLDYVDYAPTVDDVLALCMTGFPSYQAKSGHRRQLIYIGDSEMRGPADHRASLFSNEDVRQMADQAGIQINVVARSDVAAPSTESNDKLRSTAIASGGQFFLYNPAGTALTDTGTAPTLSRRLDQIRDSAPKVELPGGKVITSRSWDSPESLLIASVVAAALLCVSLAVLRR